MLSFLIGESPYTTSMLSRSFIAFMVILFSRCCVAQQPRNLKVLLDPVSFKGPRYAMMQAVADAVAEDVNRLIPGTPSDFTKQSAIICFEADAVWNRDNARKAPITLVGPKLDGEPSPVRGGTVRIALNGVAPADRWRLALQLSHELAHLKMGASYDNALIETFATAVSFQVLRDLGLYGYLLRTEGKEIQTLPEQIQYAYAFHNSRVVQEFWQSHAARDWRRLDDRALQTLGAMVLFEAGEMRWSALLGISRPALGQRQGDSTSFQITRPDIDALLREPLGLKALGYARVSR